MFDPSLYTIAWVCALSIELTAARLQLDEEHDDEDFEAPPRDENSYVFGSIGKHNIVIAALPSGVHGISSAARVTRDLIRSFNNVRIGLMVGIGGGAPLLEQDRSKKQDIRLGDVVVSEPGDGKGGVWQYDFGKSVQEQSFISTGYLDSPPRSLLSALTRLKSDTDLDGINIDEEAMARLTMWPRLQKDWRRPNASTDRLYKSTYLHPDMEKSCSSVCEVDEHLVVREARDDEDDAVKIHFGLIASANTDMRDALRRDEFARKCGVLCFDMEAAGLMNQSKFLVIRGVCDYADSHKNKEWQKYAAITAAAYARKLLMRFAPSEVVKEVKLSKLKEIKESIADVAMQVQQVAVQMEQRTTEDLRFKIKGCLEASDPFANHYTALDRRHESTGHWNFQSQAHQ